ncbi:MAG: ParB/RepB/Spo0J family partition protein, partial [Firmicutes bacterium]|nr:ParB/RepB/Spo0J family partition protein [Bacillota bacterium]
PTKQPQAGVATQLELSLIDRNEQQPRKNFDEVQLTELANNIRMHGVITPIVVVPRDNGRYMIIAGERRYRASKQAGLKKIPVAIKNYTEQQISELSLIENIQRVDLNPIETARALRHLMDEYGYTQEAVADQVNKNRSTIANTLRLLTLTNDVINLVEKGKLSEGHARTLVVIKNPELQLKLAMAAVDDKLTVRDLEKKVQSILHPPKEKAAPPQSSELRDLVERMQRVFATKVSALGTDNKGRIYIDYVNRDALDRLVEMVDRLEKP